jgi:hypothetical protein
VICRSRVGDDDRSADKFCETQGMARTDVELEANRHRTQLAKVGLGERGTPWWEQSGTERRERWESALAELDALDDSGRQDQER